LRAWLPLGAVVAIVSLGMLAYALLPSGSSLYRVIMASHSAPIATPSPIHSGRILPAPPALLPTHRQSPDYTSRKT
jgi:hypothetical protein